MGSITLTNTVAVLRDRVAEGATVRMEHGLITDVEPDGARPLATGSSSDVVIDAGGAYLLPGIIDLHNDSLEFEINPRPQANLPFSLAIGSIERRLAASGVTTEFHAISFQDAPDRGRSVSRAETYAARICDLNDGPPRAVRHEILHRLNVRSPAALAAASASLARLDVRYVSLNDHTPGQGQYRDVERLIALAQSDERRRNQRAADPAWYYERMKALDDTETVPAFYRDIHDAARTRPMTISTHDDDTVQKVDDQVAIGATVAEFPVTFEAAERARELGMTVVVGAPNVLRGGSQSGNLAAEDLIRRGLADAMCADYHAPCLLPAAFKLVDTGLCDLPAAVRMITMTPAMALGLTDRGVIAPGFLADLILVRLDADRLPHVEATYVGGRQASAFPSVATPHTAAAVGTGDIQREAIA